MNRNLWSNGPSTVGYVKMLSVSIHATSGSGIVWSFASRHHKKRGLNPFLLVESLCLFF